MVAWLVAAIVGIVQVAAAAVGLGFQFGNLLVEKRAGLFDVVDVVGIAQAALAAELFSRARLAGLEALSLMMGRRRVHGTTVPSLAVAVPLP